MKKQVRMSELESHIRDLIEQLNEKRYLEEIIPLKINREGDKTTKGIIKTMAFCLTK